MANTPQQNAESNARNIAKAQARRARQNGGELTAIDKSNNAKRRSQGKMVIDFNGSSRESKTPIATTDIQTKTAPLPEMEMDSTLANQGISQSEQVAAKFQPAEGSFEAQTADVNDNVLSILQKQIEDLSDAENNRVTAEDSFRQAQRESGILQKQERSNQLQGQLNEVVSRGQANQLSVVGQGRGIPEAILGGQQAQFARETAIESLPISAQLSAAQGDLEMAQKNVETLFKIKTADAKADYDFNVKVINMVSEFATGQENAKLEDIKMKEERKYKETERGYTEAQNSAQRAFANGQPELGSKMSQLDYKSSTFKADLAKLQAQEKDPMLALDLSLKSAQLNKINAENALAEAQSKGLALTGDEEFTEGGFANRMEKADEYVQTFEDDVLLKTGDYPSAKEGVKFRAKGKLPSEFQGEEYKRYIQAQEDFISSILRYESGAAISDEEYIRDARKYFPQPGDSKNVIDQKRRSREIVTNTMILSSKGGYQVIKDSLDDVISYNEETGNLEINNSGESQSNEEFFGTQG